jgi:Fur family iron response transcriptional regulator
MNDPVLGIAIHDARTADFRLPLSRIENPAAMTGCPVHTIRARLRDAGLRPTRQRMLLGWMLFAKGHRHVCAETLYEEAINSGVHLSLATVYNTLRQFSDANLIRQVPTGAGKAYFDTNTNPHHHYLVDGEETMLDVAGEEIALTSPPKAPPGFEVSGVDVIVRLRRVGT